MINIEKCADLCAKKGESPAAAHSIYARRHHAETCVALLIKCMTSAYSL